MILQNKVLVKISNRNKNYYINLGYLVDNENIVIDIIHLPKGSNTKIKIGCDICNKELIVAYYNYNKYRKNYGIYTCKSCSIDNKTKKTNLKRYGVESPLKCEDILNKFKKTNLEKYGHICCLLSSDIKSKTKNTSLEKYGVEIPCTSLSSKNNRRKTNIEKYGVENIFQSEQFKEKRKIYNLKNNLMITSELNDKWKIYKNHVRRITRIYKTELYEKWNGFDYYDNEFIGNYINLHHNHRNYPTIDHKISIFDGFNKGILPEIIGSISNLVITKRSINSRKNLNSINE